MANALTFSTLACPEWSIATVIANAAAYGYDGLEWRGGPRGHVHPALPAEARAGLRRAMAEAGLTSLAITAYTAFVSDQVGERQANVDELKRYVDLAAEIGARYIRAFLGEVPATVAVESVYGRIAESLEAAANYAAPAGVTIAVEPHDSFVHSSTVAAILQQVPHPALGVIWDIANAYSVGEDPAVGAQALGSRLAYVQVKDGRGRGEDWQLTALGAGAVPLTSAFALLAAGGYTGAFSVEWEYAWHRELDPPEVALPAARHYLKNLMTERTESLNP